MSDIASSYQLTDNIAEAGNQLSTMYIKELGTTNNGVGYERRSVAYLLLKLVTTEDIKNFTLSSNDPDFANFDDIVLTIETEKGKLHYAVQLKHGDTDKPMELTGTGKFSLQNFFNKFKKRKKSEIINNYRKIIYTNKNLEISEDTKITIKDDTVSFDVTVTKCEPDQLLNTSTPPDHCYRFEMVKNENSVSEPNATNVKEEFFKNLFLYTNQYDVSKTWDIIKKKFEEDFCCKGDTSMNNYLYFIKTWCTCSKSKIRLNKVIINRVIALCLLDPKEIQFKIGPLSKKNSYIFREAVSKFNIIIFDNKKSSQVEKMWSELGNNSLITEQETDQNFQAIKKFMLDCKEVSDQSRFIKSLWLLNKCPLIVENTDVTHKAIDLCPDMKYILLAEPGSNKIFPNKSVFRTLSDLESHEEIYTSILNDFTFSIQDKSAIALSFLAEKLNPLEKKNILETITTDELLAMVDGPLVICDDKEEILATYIPRRLSKNVISCKYLDKEHADFLVLISNFPEDSKILTDLQSTEDCSGDDGPSIKRHKDADRVIYTTNGSCSREDFESWSAKQNKTKCHHFKFVDDEKLEWLESKGENSVTDLKEFQLEKDDILESELHLYEHNNNVNIVCGDPGMGKTELMKKLKNSSSPASWTLMIHARNHSTHFREKKNDIQAFKKYIIERRKQRYTRFEFNFLDMFMIKNKCIEIRYIWDGLDEVSDDNLSNIMDIIEGLSKEGSKHWITSRSNLKQKLETKFNVLSRNIQQIDTMQQRQYIEDRLTGRHETELLLTSILNLVNEPPDNSALSFKEVLGIPLLIYILTELVITNTLFIHDLTQRPFFISKLYRHFIDEKFNTHNEEKLGWDRSNDCQNESYKKQKEQRIKNYEKVSMKIYFEESLLKGMNVDCGEFLTDIINNNNYDNMGIITRVVEGNNPVFFHSSFSEYFAASFLVREDSQEKIFSLSEEKFKNIRFFRNSILSEGLENLS